jgi:hypothetical protein
VRFAPLSDEQFVWLAILALSGMAIGWGLRDALLLRRLARSGGATRDQLFGPIMGLVMVALGVTGLVIHLMRR